MSVQHICLINAVLTSETVEFDPGCEAMIFTTDGSPLQGDRKRLISDRPVYSHFHVGITGGYGGDRRVEYIIPPDACKQGTCDFVIESSCNGMFGVPWGGDIIAPPDVRFLIPDILILPG